MRVVIFFLTFPLSQRSPSSLTRELLISLLSHLASPAPTPSPKQKRSHCWPHPHCWTDVLDMLHLQARKEHGFVSVCRNTSHISGPVWVTGVEWKSEAGPLLGIRMGDARTWSHVTEPRSGTERIKWSSESRALNTPYGISFKFPRACLPGCASHRKSPYQHPIRYQHSS